MATRVEQPHVPAWQRGKVASWLVTVDHKRIGILYIGTAGLFFAISGFHTHSPGFNLSACLASSSAADLGAPCAASGANGSAERSAADTRTRTADTRTRTLLILPPPSPFREP